MHEIPLTSVTSPVIVFPVGSVRAIVEVRLHWEVSLTGNTLAAPTHDGLRATLRHEVVAESLPGTLVAMGDVFGVVVIAAKGLALEIVAVSRGITARV